MDIDYVLKTCYAGLPNDKTRLEEAVEVFLFTVRDADSAKIRKLSTFNALVKIGNHILRYDATLLDGLEKKLIQLGEYGTHVSRRLKPDEQVRVGHLHSHLADLKVHVSRKTENQSLLEQAYFHRLMSGNLTAGIQPAYAAHSLTYAADIALDIFQKTRIVNWLEKAFYANSRAAAFCSAEDARHSAHTYLIAGEQAERLAVLTGHPVWNARARQSYIHFLGCCNQAKTYDLRAKIHRVEERIKRLK